MSDITKEELLAMIDVQTKSAIAMESVANSIRLVSEQNKELVKSQAEIVKAFSEEREKCTAQICLTLKSGIETATKEASANKVTIDSISKDTFWIKIIFGSIAFISAIVGIIMSISHHLATIGGK